MARRAEAGPTTTEQHLGSRPSQPGAPGLLPNLGEMGRLFGVFIQLVLPNLP